LATEIGMGLRVWPIQYRWPIWPSRPIVISAH